MQNLKRNWLVESWHEEFNKFWPEHSKISKICNLMGCFWPKYLMLQIRKYRAVMFDSTQDWWKNLKKKWFVVSKTTKIWWILMWALKNLKNLHFDWFFLVIFGLKKLSFMTLESDAKFEEKLTCGLENNMRNLANFHQSTWKSQNWDLMGFFGPKLKIYELKIYRGVMGL